MKGSVHGNGNLIALVGPVISNSEMVICNAAVDFTKLVLIFSYCV